MGSETERTSLTQVSLLRASLRLLSNRLSFSVAFSRRLLLRLPVPNSTPFSRLRSSVPPLQLWSPEFPQCSSFPLSVIVLFFESVFSPKFHRKLDLAGLPCVFVQVRSRRVCLTLLSPFVHSWKTSPFFLFMFPPFPFFIFWPEESASCSSQLLFTTVPLTGLPREPPREIGQPEGPFFLSLFVLSKLQRGWTPKVFVRRNHKVRSA